MSFKMLISNRIEKLLGVFTKAVGYLFHFMFPNKRFTIPEKRRAFIPSKTDTLIPKIMWQTNFTNKVTLPVYVNYLFNCLLSLEYEYRYVSTEARHTFMKEHASSEIFSAFEQLTNGASQADLWRIFVLNYYGGIYMDIDAHAVWPLSKMIKATDKEVFLLNKEHYTNYFIASQKNNPILERNLKIIVENIEQRKIGRGVYDLTGPGTLNEAIGESKVTYLYYKYTCMQGSFTNEYFQYYDKRRGKWTYADKETLLK